MPTEILSSRSRREVEDEKVEAEKEEAEVGDKQLW